MSRAAAAAFAALALVAAAGGWAPSARARVAADSLDFAPRDSVAAPGRAGAGSPADTAGAPAHPPAYNPQAPPGGEPSAPATPATPAARPRRGASVGPDLDRVELGAAAVQGYFSTVGTVAYRRFALEHGALQHWVVGEMTGTKRVDLWEGTASAYWMVRHRLTYRPQWRLRPLLEVGPGLHLAVQAARIRGFSTTPFHARVFVKTHAYAGAEFLVTCRLGLLVRGRMTVPNHQPFDYAQAAIFLR